MPEVGLEPHSSPCKHWAPAETCGIRAGPPHIRRGPPAKCAQCAHPFLTVLNTRAPDWCTAALRSAPEAFQTEFRYSPPVRAFMGYSVGGCMTRGSQTGGAMAANRKPTSNAELSWHIGRSGRDLADGACLITGRVDVSNNRYSVAAGTCMVPASSTFSRLKPWSPRRDQHSLGVTEGIEGNFCPKLWTGRKFRLPWVVTAQRHHARIHKPQCWECF